MYSLTEFMIFLLVDYCKGSFHFIDVGKTKK